MDDLSARYGFLTNVQVMAGVTVADGVSSTDADRRCGERAVANPSPEPIERPLQPQEDSSKRKVADEKH